MEAEKIKACKAWVMPELGEQVIALEGDDFRPEAPLPVGYHQCRLVHGRGKVPVDLGDLLWAVEHLHGSA